MSDHFGAEHQAVQDDGASLDHVAKKWAHHRLAKERADHEAAMRALLDDSADWHQT